MRICSLIPSATEMVFALGAGHLLAGVSHECDYPPEAANLPKLTRSKIPSGLPAQEIDRAVSSTLEAAGTLYELDLELLDKLQPDLILTQRLCDVCAVSFDLVEQAVSALQSRPAILNLEPHSLSEVLESIRTLGDAIGYRRQAEELIINLQRRIDAVREKSTHIVEKPRVLCMEWVDPPYCGGHWMKELVEIAGGRDDLSNHHRPSYRIEWQRVLEFAPEVIVLTCCGFDLERCGREAEVLSKYAGVHQLPAARDGRIFATDSSSYFSRSGPRIVDSLEILAHLIHPEIFAAPPLTRAFAAVKLAWPGALAIPQF